MSEESQSHQKLEFKNHSKIPNEVIPKVSLEFDTK